MINIANHTHGNFCYFKWYLVITDLIKPFLTILYSIIILNFYFLQKIWHPFLLFPTNHNISIKQIMSNKNLTQSQLIRLKKCNQILFNWLSKRIGEMHPARFRKQ